MIDLKVGDVLVAIIDWKTFDDFIYVTKGKKYKVIQIDLAGFTLIDNKNSKILFNQESLKKDSIFYLFEPLSKVRNEKIKSLEL